MSLPVIPLQVGSPPEPVSASPAKKIHSLGWIRMPEKRMRLQAADPSFR
jgi:hypothetical protein